MTAPLEGPYLGADWRPTDDDARSSAFWWFWFWNMLFTILGVVAELSLLVITAVQARRASPGSYHVPLTQPIV